MKFAHCLRKVFVIGKHTIIFWKGDLVLGVDFHLENLP